MIWENDTAKVDGITTDNMEMLESVLKKSTPWQR